MTRVLLIDDDEVTRRVMARGLRRRGYDVTEADNGAAVVHAPSPPDVDIVVTDILMPDVDGLEVLRSLRTRAPWLPVIGMSGGWARFDADTTLSWARATGAAAVLAKPAGITLVVDAIQTALQAA